VEAPSRIEMASEKSGETSTQVRERVIRARQIAYERFSDCSWKLNSHIPPRELRTRFKAEKSGMAFLHSELDSEKLSARAFHKVLRLAWSIADQQGHVIPLKADVERAYHLREGLELFQ
jgi:magnesium chelatase family protein